MIEPDEYFGTRDAAQELGVSPNVLRRWEGYFGFPMSSSAESGRRRFLGAEVCALRDAIGQEHTIPGAIARARERLAKSMREALHRAYASRDEAAADQVVITCLASRSLEVAVSDVIAGALDRLAWSHQTGSREWAFASAHAMHVLSAIISQVGAAGGAPVLSYAPEGTVLLADATADALDADAVYVRALELLLRRNSHWRVETCSVLDRPRVRDAGSGPSQALLIAGGARSDDEVTRWADQTRRQLRPATTAFYRRSPPVAQCAERDRVLPEDPAGARRRLIELLG